MESTHILVKAKNQTGNTGLPKRPARLCLCRQASRQISLPAGLIAQAT